MKLLIDTHVHTVASGHAYSTIDEIAKVATIKGLEIIAITDHAPSMPGGAHEYYFNNMVVLPEYLHGIRILKGVETNIIDYEGNIDLEPETLKNLDLVIASLHPPCIPYSDKETITNTVIKTMENPYVHIIGHPGDNRYPLDMEQIVLHAKKNHVLLEVNNSSLKPTSFRVGVRENLVDMLRYCKKYEVPVVVATDAHFSYDVGEFKESIELFKQVNFPESLIINSNQDGFMKFITKER